MMIPAATILARAASLRLLVVGDVMLDHYILGDVARLSAEAPVPVALATRDEYLPGGAANVATNLAALGAKVWLAGRIGPDVAGLHLCERLARAEVGFLSLRPRLQQTTTKIRLIAQGQHLCRIDREDPAASAAATALAPEAFVRALAGDLQLAHALVLSDYAKGVLAPAPLQALIAAAQGKFIAFDPKPTARRPAVDCRGVDLIMPNRTEAALLAGLAWEPGETFPLETVARALFARHGVRHIVITLSEDGMALVEQGQITCQLPAALGATPHPGRFLNPCGAGDTALAAMALALAGGAATPAEALAFANTAAGLACTKPGTATVTAAELLPAA